MPKVEYKWLRTDEELRRLAQEMRIYARQNPLDQKHVQNLIENEPGEKEQLGPMTRIHGKEAGILSTSYSRYVTFSAKNPEPLQICFLEYKTRKGRLRQLTITNNIKGNVAVRTISRIATFFLDMSQPDDIIMAKDTPPHVACLLQRENHG